MGNIDTGRVILGGIVAGFVINLLSFLVDGFLLATQWADAMKALSRPAFSGGQMLWFNIFGFVVGIILIWIYAAIRPRLGPGPKTALIAGIVVWILCYLIPNVSFMSVANLFDHRLTLHTTLGNLIEVLAGALAGGFLYRESTPTATLS